MKFSANLGFLWTDRPLPDAIRAAAAAGFAAVECHWPYDHDPATVLAALQETGLPMLGLNTRTGAPGELGLAALAGRVEEARAAIDEAIAYATSIGARNVHVMAGVHGDAAVYAENLAYACDKGADRGLTILIEPLNASDAPDYFLRTTGQAVKIIDDLGRANLRLMFDCYHVQLTEGDVIARLKATLPHIGHIQFASVPDRAEPDAGTLDYRAVFQRIRKLGYERPLGAEYRPRGTVEAGLGWMRDLTA